LTVFGAEPEDACDRCLNPERTGAFSCTRYALETEAATAIPAIQNSAAALAAFVAEQAILWLHGAAPLRNRRAFLDLRAPSIEAVGLVADPDCPGVHWGMQPATADQSQIVEAGPAEPLARLLTIVRERYGRAEVRLPAPLVLRIACPGCGELTEPRTQEWRWLTTPRCEGCGGPFPQAEQQRAPSGIERLDVDLEDEVAALSCGAAGLPAGASFEVYPYEGQPLLLRLPGTIEQMMQIV
ncbi:MAG: hypothetical protein ACR2HB_08055, partial [Dehalococcoidia bacterium]